MSQSQQEKAKSPPKFSPLDPPHSPSGSPMVSSELLAIRTIKARQGVPEQRGSNPTISSMSSPEDSDSSSDDRSTTQRGQSRSKAQKREALRQSIEKLTEELILSAGLKKEAKDEVAIVKVKGTSGVAC